MSDELMDPAKGVIASIFAGLAGVFAGTKIHGAAIANLQKSLDNHIAADAKWKQSTTDKIDRIIEREIDRSDHGGT